EQRIQKISRIIDNKLYIDFEQIQYDAYYELYLYEILRIYGFTSMQIKSITSSISMQTGKKFYSNTHVLRVNRDQFVISKSSSQNRLEITVNKEDEIVSIQYATIAFSVIRHKEIDDIKNPYHAYLNFDEISFPLTIRNWRKGDRFIPYGNKGIKKLSDYFIDQKIESGEKNNIILLVSGDDIIWVAPHRIDERYKVSSNSNRILKVVLTRK
ncbi:MAG: tRNA lysidine(34) synthetase TilS, partial [Bacteroidetes bacterium]|nr:tRNA lysidine(34) synthetase TilS [Bacteroidota bacterium]